MEFSKIKILSSSDKGLGEALLEFPHISTYATATASNPRAYLTGGKGVTLKYHMPHDSKEREVRMALDLFFSMQSGQRAKANVAVLTEHVVSKSIFRQEIERAALNLNCSLPEVVLRPTALVPFMMRNNTVLAMRLTRDELKSSPPSVLVHPLFDIAILAPKPGEDLFSAGELYASGTTPEIILSNNGYRTVVLQGCPHGQPQNWRLLKFATNADKRPLVAQGDIRSLLKEHAGQIFATKFADLALERAKRLLNGIHAVESMTGQQERKKAFHAWKDSELNDVFASIEEALYSSRPNHAKQQEAAPTPDAELEIEFDEPTLEPELDL